MIELEQYLDLRKRLAAWRAQLSVVGKQLLERALIEFWKRRDPVVASDARPSIALGDNVQTTMNLVMPLLDPTPVGRVYAAQAVSSSVDELFTGLNAVGTVHFARFDIIDGNLCMFSVFDGDFTTYIRDFITLFGDVFDALMELVKDPPPTPCELNPEAFIDWIHAHDARKVPQDLDLLVPHLRDIRNLPRALVLIFDENPHIELGFYRGYPGFSAAQIRDRLGVGW
ncbi:MAG: hypothetical protein ACXWCB_07185 [Acidimicrobiales bacterium]